MLVQLVSVCTLSQRHLERVIFTVHVHTSALQPRDPGLAAHSHSAHGPFSGISQHPAARGLLKYHVRQEGMQNVSNSTQDVCAG